MPLRAGKTQKDISSNIRKLVKEGYPVKQAAAISYSKSREDNPMAKKVTVASLVSEVQKAVGVKAPKRRKRRKTGSTKRKRTRKPRVAKRRKRAATTTKRLRRVTRRRAAPKRRVTRRRKAKSIGAHKSHRRGRRCHHCGKAHSTSSHRSHGAGSYKRTHSGKRKAKARRRRKK